MRCALLASSLFDHNQIKKKEKQRHQGKKKILSDECALSSTHTHTHGDDVKVFGDILYDMIHDML